ncbi:MAG: metallophosphoesterase [Pseudomonadales bacterium]
MLGGLFLFAAWSVNWLIGQSSDIVLSSENAETGALRVVVLGDQGTGTLRQRQVAWHMDDVAAQLGGFDFALLAGDNFYGSGVDSIDDPHWRFSFENVYQGKYLQGLRFYAVIGNHDAKGNVDALLAYSNQQRGSNRWRLPARHYIKDFGRSPTCLACPLLRVVFLDTTQVSSTLAEEAEFVMTAFRDAKSIWRVVIAHHPIRNYGAHGETANLAEAFLPALRESDVHLYISGHDHNQQIIQRAKEPLYLISGAGGKKAYPVNTGEKDLLASSEENGFSVLEFNDQTLSIDMYGESDQALSRTVLAHADNIQIGMVE